jgi:hypothetical protein
VVDAIYEYTKVGLPIDPIVKFLENLMHNSSKNSILEFDIDLSQDLVCFFG